MQSLNWFANARLNSRLLCIFESRCIEAPLKLYKGYIEVSASNPHVVSGSTVFINYRRNKPRPELTIWWLSRTSKDSVPSYEVLLCSDGAAYTEG